MGVRARVRACVTAAFCSYLGSHSKQYAYQCIFKTGASGGKGARAGARPPPDRGQSARSAVRAPLRSTLIRTIDPLYGFTLHRESAAGLCGGARPALVGARGERGKLETRPTLKYQDD